MSTNSDIFLELTISNKTRIKKQIEQLKNLITIQHNNMHEN